MATHKKLQVSTTVTPRAYEVLRGLTAFYQTNDVLSAALIAFGELSEACQRKRIKEVRESKPPRRPHG